MTPEQKLKHLILLKQEAWEPDFLAPVAPAKPDHTKQANAALAAASNHTRDIVKLANEAHDKAAQQKGQS
jgi:hypothetical protein